MADTLENMLKSGAISQRQAQRMMTHDAERAPDATSRVANRIAGWPGRIAGAGGDAITSGPRMMADVGEGRLDPNSPEAVRRSTDVAANTMGMGMLGAQRGSLGMAGGSIKAYHGSPYTFDKFDLSKIGTGEGAQAYGHGLYFAENEGVAKGYRDKLAGSAVNPNDPEHMAFAYLHGLSDRPTAIQALRDNARNHAPGNVASPAVLNKAADILESGATPKHLGKMYEVNIKADPEHFLDWDKPFAEQPQKVQQAINNLWTAKGGSLEGRANPPFVASNDTGEAIHAAIATTYGKTGKNFDAQKAATDALRKEGVSGIKYLDQGSRSAGTGTNNYVVFDDKLIDIMKKYGIVGVGALPAMGAYHYQTPAAAAPAPSVDPQALEQMPTAHEAAMDYLK